MAGCVRWLAVASVFCAMVGASVGGVSAEPNMTMRVGGSTSAPIGHTEFCQKFQAECVPSGGAAPLQLTEGRWRELIDVNRTINRTITPVTDLEFYHRDELWTLPSAYGDCEDYVLLKRSELIRRGWPSGSLLVTVVFDEVGEGHAVLLAVTSRGELVLDNKTDAVRPWHETAYRYVKRQSETDPRRWVSIGDPRWTTLNTAAPR
jgi:predicted transglutaminase-like cysteine proteinase